MIHFSCSNCNNSPFTPSSASRTSSDSRIAVGEDMRLAKKTPESRQFPEKEIMLHASKYSIVNRGCGICGNRRQNKHDLNRRESWSKTSKLFYQHTITMALKSICAYLASILLLRHDFFVFDNSDHCKQQCAVCNERYTYVHRCIAYSDAGLWRGRHYCNYVEK